jgi:hypothetical protein
MVESITRKDAVAVAVIAVADVADVAAAALEQKHCGDSAHGLIA